MINIINNIHFFKCMLYLFFVIEAKLNKLDITEFGMHLFSYEEWVIFFFKLRTQNPMASRNEEGKWG